MVSNFPSCPPFLQGKKSVYCGHRPGLPDRTVCQLSEQQPHRTALLLGPVMSFGTGVIKEAGADLHICPPVITGQTRGLDEAERNLGLNKESWGV